MAQFSNLPQTKDEQIEQTQKIINYLSDKIDKLESKIDRLESKIKEKDNGNKGTED